MKVVLVTHDGAFGRWLAAPLWKAGAMDAVLVEAARPRLRFYWRKLARAGIRDFAFQAWLARWYEREGAHAPGGAGGGAAASYITAATLARMPNGFLNLHTGYLPLYRGVKSELWALARGDTARLGRTLHYMTPELDAGDIVLRRCVEWEGDAYFGEADQLVRSKLITQSGGS